MGVTHVRAYRHVPGVRIAALCNPSGRHLDGDFSGVAGDVGTDGPFRLDMRGVKATKSFADLIADPDIHVIDVCAPTKAHVELSVAALRAGKHVVCEKPLARTPQAAREIAAAARTAMGFLMPAMCMRFWPEWAWLRAAIQNQRFGKVLSASFRRVAEPPAWGQTDFLHGAESGGALFDLHIHDTDFVQFCFGRPRRVHSRGYKKVSGAVDHVVTQYEVDSGAIVHAEGSWAMAKGFGFSMTYCVNFDRATVDYDLSRASDKLRLIEEGKLPVLVPCEGADGYVGELTHFIESIRAGKPPSVVTVDDGVSAVEICAAEERSVLTGSAERV
jgi:predicted dehydrogenase